MPSCVASSHKETTKGLFYSLIADSLPKRKIEKWGEREKTGKEWKRRDISKQYDSSILCLKRVCKTMRKKRETEGNEREVETECHKYFWSRRKPC